MDFVSKCFSDIDFLDITALKIAFRYLCSEIDPFSIKFKEKISINSNSIVTYLVENIYLFSSFNLLLFFLMSSNYQEVPPRYLYPFPHKGLCMVVYA